MMRVPERYRITKGIMESDATYGNNGAFKISRGRITILAIASDGEGWEHVSIRAVTDGKDRTLTWAEMCFIKDFLMGVNV